MCTEGTTKSDIDTGQSPARFASAVDLAAEIASLSLQLSLDKLVKTKRRLLLLTTHLSHAKIIVLSNSYFYIGCSWETDRWRIVTHKVNIAHCQCSAIQVIQGGSVCHTVLIDPSSHHRAASYPRQIYLPHAIACTEAETGAEVSLSMSSPDTWEVQRCPNSAK